MLFFFIVAFVIIAGRIVYLFAFLVTRQLAKIVICGFIFLFSLLLILPCGELVFKSYKSVTDEVVTNNIPFC